MATMRLYNCTTALMPKNECIFLLGDNSEHDKPNPWQPALRIVHLLGMATDEENHYRVARHYTLRHANSPQDDDAVKRILAQQIASTQEQSGGEVDLSDVPQVDASSSAAMLACQILVDGGDDHSSMDERLHQVPRELWHPNPVPKGRSAVGTSGPDGGYVLLQDLPKPVLEEHVVGFVGMRLLPPSEDKEGGAGEEAKRCELNRLYVDPEEDESLYYELVELMAEHAKSSGYGSLRLAPGMEIGPAKIIFEKASVAALGSKAAARRVEVGDHTSGKVVEVWEMNLSRWLGPAGGSASA